MYVTDSLFYLQHLLGGDKDDEDKKMFSLRYRDMFDENRQNVKPENADDIIERMIKKSQNL